MCPELALWHAVIRQAASDYKYGVRGERDSIESVRREVSNSVRSNWFIEVCEMAGLDYSRVLSYFKKLEQKYK